MKRVLDETDGSKTRGQKKGSGNRKKKGRKKREKNQKSGFPRNPLFRPSEGSKKHKSSKTQGLPLIGENVFF